jgi:glutaredoxin 3
MSLSNLFPKSIIIRFYWLIPKMQSLGVKDMIKTGQITIFLIPSCPYCTKAKSLFKSMGLNYKTIDIYEEDFSSDQIMELRSLSNGHRTYPNIFIGTQPVGGFTDLQALQSRKKLDDLLFSQGVKI